MPNYVLRIGTSVNYTVTAGQGLYTLTGQAVTLSTSASSNEITINLSTSISSGAAPLAVRFDARATTTTLTQVTSALGGVFRQLKYDFDFGDNTGATWSFSGDSKNTQSGGPFATHVFDSGTTVHTVSLTVTAGHPWATSTSAAPGAYIVGDIVTNGGSTYTCAQAHTPGTFATDLSAGKWTLFRASLVQTSTTVPITVTAADTAYSGTNTICINGTGTNDGLGPSGAAYFTTVAAAGGFASNKRYLYKAGGTYADIDLSGAVSNIRVGKYGSGAKPNINGYIFIGGNASTSNIAISDLQCVNGVYTNTGHHLLINRVDVNLPSANMSFYSQEDNTYLNMNYQYFVECTGTDPAPGSAAANMYGRFSKAAILGCDFDYAGQHNIRLINSFGTQLSHNRLRHPLAGKHCIKMPAYGSSSTVWDEVANTQPLATSYNIISNNVFGSTDSQQDWTVAIDSMNDTAREAITDVICENNDFYRGTSGSPTDIVEGGRRITRRGNVSLNSSFIASTGVNNPASGFDGPYFAR